MKKCIQIQWLARLFLFFLFRKLSTSVELKNFKNSSNKKKKKFPGSIIDSTKKEEKSWRRGRGRVTNFTSTANFLSIFLSFEQINKWKMVFCKRKSFLFSCQAKLYFSIGGRTLFDFHYPRTFLLLDLRQFPFLEKLIKTRNSKSKFAVESEILMKNHEKMAAVKKSSEMMICNLENDAFR